MNQLIISFITIEESTSNMKITLQFHEDGIIINRWNQSQIFVPRLSWMKLVELKHILQHYMQNRNENNWIIGENLRVSVSLYKDCILLHIRIWSENHPTQQGVTLNVSEWNYLFSFLNYDKEEEYSIETFQKILSHRMQSIQEDNCEGCEKGWRSQKDHACLEPKHERREINGFIDEAFDSINYFEFLVNLSQIAQKRSILVKRPYEMFHHIKMIKKEELKKKILMEYAES